MTADEDRGNANDKLEPREGLVDAGCRALFDRLNSEHREIFQLFDAVEGMDGNKLDSALKIFTRLEEALMTHLEGEERFFYTALEPHDDASEMVLQGYEQHLVAKTLLASFKSLALDDRRWKPKLKVLRQLFELHARQEEALIDQTKAFLPGDQARGIVEQLQEFRNKGGSTKAVGEPVADL